MKKRIFKAGTQFFSLLVILSLIPFSIAHARDPKSDPNLFFDGKILGLNVASWLASQNLDGNKVISGSWVSPQSLRHGREIDNNIISRRHTQALLNWALSQEDASIDPQTFYAKCLEITDFNIQHALILAWNVLSKRWQYALQRNTEELSQKLVDITGELPDFDGSYHYAPVLNKDGQPQKTITGKLRLQQVVTKRGDNRGAWYHFFGTALSGYTYSLGYGKYPWLTYLFIEMERFESNQTSGIANKKRIAIDRAGADFGFALLKSLTVDRSGILRLEEGLSPQNKPYLYDNPDYYGKDYALKDGQRPWFYGQDLTTDHPVFKSRDYLKALLSPGGRQRLVLDPVRLFLSSEGEMIISILEDYKKSGDVDLKLDALLSKSKMKTPWLNDYMETDLFIDYERLTPPAKKQVDDGIERFNKAAQSVLDSRGREFVCLRCMEF